MMKRNFRISAALLLVLALCIQMLVPAFAANNKGVEFTATLDKSTINVSSETQTVVLTVKANQEIGLDSLTAHARIPEGFSISSITNEDLNFKASQHNVATGDIAWYWEYDDGNDLTYTDLIAVVTYTIPANTPAGTYTIEFEIEDISEYWATWEDGTTVSATLTIVDPNAPTETTVTGNIATYADANGWADATQYSTIVMDDVVTVTANGGGNTGKYYVNGEQWRIYQTESPSVVVSAAEGYTIKSVTITYAVNNYGVLTYNGSNIESGTAVEVSASSVTFGVGNTGSKTNGQVRITDIQVTYVASSGSGETPPACEHTNTSVKDAVTAGCTTEGHTGKTVCDDCGATVNEGEAIPATGHSYENGVCKVCGTAEPVASTWIKVTTAPSDWSGTYLIVYEEGNVIFDGSLTTLDAVNDCKDVTITDGKIVVDDMYAFVISAVQGGYSIRSASGYYIGQTSDANGLKSSTSTAYANSISLNDDGSVNIVSGGAYLRFNSASNQMRFRYYKSSSYENQKSICLYKLVDPNAPACEHEYDNACDTSCNKCGETREVGEHSFTTKASNQQATPADCDNAATYYVQCDNCDAVSDTKTVAVGNANGHAFNTKASSTLASAADCDNAATYYVQCDNCDAVDTTKTVEVGEERGHGHTAGFRYSSDGAGTGTHTKYCNDCNAAIEGEKNVTCSGGTATCTAKAECSTCGAEYGEVDENNHTSRATYIRYDDAHTVSYPCCGATKDELHTYDKTTHRCVCGALEKFTITLNANGGKFNSGAVAIDVSGEYGTDFTAIPEMPTKDGSDLIGWTDESGNTIVLNDYKFTATITVYAQWCDHADTKAVDNGDGTHDIVCANEKCNKVITDNEPHSYDKTPGTCVCGVKLTGWIDNSYYENGEKVTGWKEVDGAWYYFGENGYCTGLQRLPYLTELGYKPNQEDIDYAANKGTAFKDATEAWFYFDQDGKLMTGFTGILDGKYVENGMIPWHPGFVEVDGEWYYFVGDAENGGNKMANGQIYVTRNAEAAGYETGDQIVFVNGQVDTTVDGIVDKEGVLYYYESGKLMAGNGLTKIGDKYIYVRSSGKLAVGEYYIPANDLGVVSALYTFDANGYMVMPKYTDVNGVVEGFYYVDGKVDYGAGLIEWNGDIYYVRSNGQVATGWYYVTNVNEMEGFQKGMKLNFGEDGKLQPVKNGIVEENGELYYYENNHVQYGAGLLKLEDENGVYYIYVRSSGKVQTGYFYITKTNDLEGFEAGMKLNFGEDGKYYPGK